ncbi:helix-turn-helix transcriptional regulator [Mycolicibacterium brumae]|uniref:Helix-turn-helix transcriptional regulator n=1 Tax=Mycolicibacterium brumae TaxID=85968 RepID=A0A2G5PAL0_9MYCO|nr:LuxR family transcriptional regulator [Mycolicibacterium brumae]MCV7193071.1 AAA family ATPase [Mycolicibacterium brumae]PIB75385.1 helix-turn-helix transcriptional regulator [Mycolicibacterium brumae]RWA22005.1 hypothetical protein MBRU_13545 [Mycolicibacterium brumae DSM 44177]UWW07927.1 LuxR family transcriptional regulator [Mycolicibacterium brumae]
MAGVIGRTQLRDRLGRHWDGARNGAGRVLVLIGDPGIGKSSMLNWLGARAGRAARTVSCRGGEFAAPMSTAADVLAALSGPNEAKSLAAEVDPLLAGETLRRALEQHGPVALLIDDIHDADPTSRTALNLALRRAETTDALTVITGRRVTATTTFSEGFAIEEMRGLDEDSAIRLLRGAATAPITPEITRHLLDLADGNPLALINLPKVLTPDELSGARPLPDEIPLSSDLRAVFTQQLPPQGCPPRDLLNLAAVTADGDWAVLAALRPAAAEALPVLEHDGLARLHRGRLQLQHPLLRSALIAVMPAPQQRELDLELADCPLLSDDVRLLHRARGVIGPDESLVDELTETARLTRKRGGTDAAALILDRAVDLTADVARRHSLLLEAAQLLSSAGDAPGARRRLEDLLAEPEARDLHVSAILTLATLEATNGAPGAGWNRLHQALETAPPDALGAVYARMCLPLGMLGLVTVIADSADTAVSLSKPDTREWGVARVINAHAVSAQDESRAQQLVDELSGGPDLVDLVEFDPMIGLHIGRALAIGERYDTAVDTLTALAGRLHGEGARSSLAMTLGALGETWIRASRFDEALSCLDEAIALSMSTGQRAFAPFWLSLRARIRAVRGDDEAATDDLELGFAISDEQSTVGARYFLLANAGFAALTAQRYDDAITALEELWSFEQIGGLLSPQLARWHADLVEAYVAVGRPTEAEPVAEHLVAVAATGSASRWTTATALRAQSLLHPDPDQARALLDRALSVYHPAIDGFDYARTLLLKSQSDGCGATAAAARHAFRRLGAAPWAARLDPAAAVDGMGALTDAERRILEQVANGLTNRQIAKRLGVSTKTVANHLYHAYRKLGVGSRTEAARFVLLGETPGRK